MIRGWASGFVGVSAVSLAACAAPVDPIVECAPAAGITPVCGLANPEDLVDVGDGGWLIVSQGRGSAAGGSLITMRPSGDGRTPLFPGPRGPERAALGLAAYGAPGCADPPRPDLFAPHGIDLSRGSDGIDLLWVVNHGGREAVEVFELRSEDPPALEWRGCVPLPGRAFANDVAALPGGGFVVTNMMPRSGLLGVPWIVLRMSLGWNTGTVLEWTPEEGWRQIPGTKSSGPNGIAVSRDGETLYVAAWGSHELLRMRRSDGGDRRRVPLRRPDNLTWTRDGRLLVTGQTAPASELLVGCTGVEVGTCGASFTVWLVDPVTLESEVVHEHAGGPPMGAASVALQVGDEIVIGSFVGDRVGRLPFPG